MSFRLGVQVILAAGLVYAGLSLPTFEVPYFQKIRWESFTIPLTVIFVVWLTNLYNFMDGMDGFAGGMTAFGFGCLAYFAWKGDQQFMLVVSLLLSLSSLGFLAHNFPPARIFMGDVGSQGIGFLCAALILLGWQERIFTFWVPILIFSPFIVDATSTLFSRAIRCERLWQAHRQHYYQRAVLSGWSHRRVVLVEYALMVTCIGFAVLYEDAKQDWRVVILAAWLMLFVGCGWMVTCLEQRKPHRDGVR